MGDTGGAQAGAQNPGGNGAAEALTAAGGLTSAYGALTAGKTNKNIAESNAVIARAQSQEALAAGEFDAGRIRARAARTAATALAGQAGQGVVAGAGTGGAVVADSQRAGAMDALMIQRQARRQALGFETKAIGEEEQGVAAEEEGRSKALATLLNTGSQEFLESDPSYSGYKGRGIGFGGKG